MYYTGFGCKSAPADILLLMRRIALMLAKEGWSLRSGGTTGPEMAFEAGALAGNGTTEIYLPWKNFNGHPSSRYKMKAEAYALAESLHPAWARLKDSAKSLQARSCCTVLGADLVEPSSMLIYWTPDGCVQASEVTKETGDARTAIVLADQRRIPRFNLVRGWALDALREFVREGRLPTYMREASQP